MTLQTTHYQAANLNYDTKSNSLPSFIQPILNDSSNFLDNLLADAYRQLQVARCCREANITKRSGYQPMQVRYLLLLMQWLKESSIAMFCRDSMLSFCLASHDVLHDFLKREDLTTGVVKCAVMRCFSSVSCETHPTTVVPVGSIQSGVWK